MGVVGVVEVVEERREKGRSARRTRTCKYVENVWMSLFSTSLPFVGNRRVIPFPRAACVRAWVHVPRRYGLFN